MIFSEKPENDRPTSMNCPNVASFHLNLRPRIGYHADCNKKVPLPPMFQKILLPTLALGAVLGIQSCDNDINLTGKYEERAVVYGLMDPANNPSNGGPGHLFRIQKMFLGEASAVDMALVPDSNYFPYDDLEVHLLEIIDTLNRKDTVKHKLDTAMINTKLTTNSGNVHFFGPQQRVYRANFNMKTYRPLSVQGAAINEREYGLLIHNTKTGYKATSIMKPANANPFRWANPDQNGTALFSLNLYSSVNQSYSNYTVRFKCAANVRTHEAWLRFHYREVSGTDTVHKQLYWRLSKFDIVPSTTGGVEYTYQIFGENVISFIGSNITPEPGKTYFIGRRYNNIASGVGAGVGPVAFDIVLLMAGTELSDMLALNDPNSTSVVQEVPIYSNITNGTGVFSSRVTREFKDMYLKGEVVQELKVGPYTQHIGFRTDQ